jgi:hypothetical protein
MWDSMDRMRSRLSPTTSGRPRDSPVATVLGLGGGKRGENP